MTENISPDSTPDRSSTPGSENAEEVARNERQEVFNFITDLKAKISAKLQFRNENLKRVLPGEEHFARLDSSLEKNTAFVKKLKQFTAAQLDSLTKEMNGLNLSKYISEICTALSDAKIKITDVPAVVCLCSHLHQTYVDFDAQFLKVWQKSLAIKTCERVPNPSKLRVDLRLFAELVNSGVIGRKEGTALLGKAMWNLLLYEDFEDFFNFSILYFFCVHCSEEYAGRVPKNIVTLALKYDIEIPNTGFLYRSELNIFK